jgi:hypothetical protein
MVYPDRAVTGVPSVLVAGAAHDNVAVPVFVAVTVTVALWAAVPPEPVQLSV